MTADAELHTVLQQFERLDRALIDASSLIYMEKCGFLYLLADSLELQTLPAIRTEAGPAADRISLIQPAIDTPTADESLIACALGTGLPLISEDKKILNRMDRENHPYFNSLMMLNYLLFKHCITPDDYQYFLKALHEIAWYGPRIWRFGEKLQEMIARIRHGLPE